MWFVWAATLKVSFVRLGGVKGALKYAVVGVVAIVVVVVVAAALVLLPTQHQMPVQYVGFTQRI